MQPYIGSKLWILVEKGEVQVEGTPYTHNMTEDEQEMLEVVEEEEAHGMDPVKAYWRSRARRDILVQRIMDRYEDTEVIVRILEKVHALEFDYVTPQGGVIANVFFPMKHSFPIQGSEEGWHAGRKDLTFEVLSQLDPDPLVRPKIPGHLRRGNQVNDGHCAAYVEDFAGVSYGLSEKVCDCCLYNEWVKLSQYKAEDWHEGLMVLHHGEEYRVKKMKTLDLMYKGAVWEHEWKGRWVPLRPRESYKREQSLEKAKSVVTVDHLFLRNDAIPTRERQQMSKVIVATPTGYHFHQQDSGWDFVGGKRQAKDKSPKETAYREYYEETGLIPKNLDYVSMFVTEAFDVHVYFTFDDRLSRNVSESSLHHHAQSLWKMIQDKVPMIDLWQLHTIPHGNQHPVETSYSKWQLLFVQGNKEYRHMPCTASQWTKAKEGWVEYLSTRTVWVLAKIFSVPGYARGDYKSFRVDEFQLVFFLQALMRDRRPWFIEDGNLLIKVKVSARVHIDHFKMAEQYLENIFSAFKLPFKGRFTREQIAKTIDSPSSALQLLMYDLKRQYAGKASLIPLLDNSPLDLKSE